MLAFGGGLCSLSSFGCYYYCYSGRVYSDGGSDTAATRESRSRITAGRQLRRPDDVIVRDVITHADDVTTPAAARRRQTGRRRTSRVVTAANRGTLSQKTVQNYFCQNFVKFL